MLSFAYLSSLCLLHSNPPTEDAVDVLSWLALSYLVDYSFYSPRPKQLRGLY